jgi:hypothetical protein
MQESRAPRRGLFDISPSGGPAANAEWRMINDEVAIFRTFRPTRDSSLHLPGPIRNAELSLFRMETANGRKWTRRGCYERQTPRVV